MPGHHGFRLDHDQRFGPALPQLAEHNPEEPIEAIQFRAGLLPLEDSELLAKSDGFQSEFVAWQEKGTQVSNCCTGKGNHRRILAERRPQAKWCRFNRLILLRDGILMTHKASVQRARNIGPLLQC